MRTCYFCGNTVQPREHIKMIVKGDHREEVYSENCPACKSLMYGYSRPYNGKELGGVL